MIIETNRLKIVPLTKEQFRLLLLGTDKVEQALGLTPSCESMDEDTLMAMEHNYKEALKYPDHYLWYTNWQIILKSENKAIGSACFKHKPDKYGQVEIGYGTNPDYRNQGYMTEMVKALSEWALQQTDVNSVIAGTDKDNQASMRVLEKCGAVRYKVTDTGLWWKLRKTFRRKKSR
ncbi:MAG: GNAT family N-acetyltransferase [Prevotella sp.]|jgi:RimJ/RimL family protein N-acetyltransferase|nr:GNAT family N-acetyltransferase [Prevotella sp.]